MDKNEAQRLRRRLNNNSYTKKYEKTKSGFLMRLYRNMQSRVTGVQRKKLHLYAFCSLLSREEFYKIMDASFARHYIVSGSGEENRKVLFNSNDITWNNDSTFNPETY